MVIFGLGAPVVHAQDRGIQLSRNGTRVLVNKDVGDERWAISLNTLTNTVTGNVFTADGGPPSFIFCESVVGLTSFACQGAGPCTGNSCVEQFVDLGVVSLPADFFLPPGVDLSTVATSRGDTPDQTAHAAMTNVGFQETPDREHVLVSSDVGNERWAIALNRSDRTLTGNVFLPGGGDPSFVSCQQTFSVPDSFGCWGAGPCVEDGCEDQYTFISTVALPAGFFGPQQCGDTILQGNERCEAGSFCFALCGVDSLCNILVGVAPIPMPGTCTNDCQLCAAANLF